MECFQDLAVQLLAFDRGPLFKGQAAGQRKALKKVILVEAGCLLQALHADLAVLQVKMGMAEPGPHRVLNTGYIQVGGGSIVVHTKKK